MKLPRREFLHLAAGAAALPALPRVASALDYPTRPVHIIVGFQGEPRVTSYCALVRAARVAAAKVRPSNIQAGLATTSASTRFQSVAPTRHARGVSATKE